MRRTPLKRTGRPLRRSWLRRGSRLARRGARAKREQAAWEAGRREALARARGMCARCGLHARLEVHHRKPRARGGTHVPANLVALCAGVDGCHAQITAHRATDWRDWID